MKNSPGVIQGIALSLLALNAFTVSRAVEVQTFAPADVTNGYAILQGAVNPQSVPTAVHFEWGVMDLFDQATESADVGDGTSNVLATASLSNLTVGLTYRFRLAAETTNGVTRGAAISFGLPTITITEDGPVTGQCINGASDSGFVVSQGLVQIAAGGRNGFALTGDGVIRAWGNNTYGQTDTPSNAEDVIAISGGLYHGLGLQKNGTVIGWGNNTYKQTNTPASLSNVVSVAAGYSHSLALKSNGKVEGWGDNSAGQIAPPNSLSNVVAIAAGEKHSLALTAAGKVVGWGKFIISGFSNNVTIPLDLSNVVAIAAGANHDLALKSDGTIVAWGDNNQGQTGLSNSWSNVVAIAAGSKHSIAVLAGGTVVGCGDGVSGQLNIPAGLTNVVGIAAHSLHTLAIEADGTVTGWGFNLYGQVSVPTSLAVMDLATNQTTTTDIASTDGYTRVYTYINPAGAVATAERALVLICPPSALTLPATGVMNDAATFRAIINPDRDSTTAWFEWGVMDRFDHVSAVTNVGNGGSDVIIDVEQSGLAPGVTYRVRVVASNRIGTVRSFPVSFGVPLITLNGDAYITNGCGVGYTEAGAIVSALPSFLSAGAAHGVVLKCDGSVTGWGGNVAGQLTIPAGLSNIVGIAAGNSNSLAISSDGSIVEWGDNSSSQNDQAALLGGVIAVSLGSAHGLALKGDGSLATWGSSGSGLSSIPADAFPASAIAAGGSNSIVLKADGTIVEWGDNSFGQTNTPAGLTNASAVAAGAGHGLALRLDGTVIAWGDNSFGQTNTPVGLSNVVSIAAGARHNLALLIDGSVIAWGDNAAGQTNTPAGLSNVVAIAAGDRHSLALVDDGTIVGWGDNGSFQTTVPSEIYSNTLTLTQSGTVDTNTPGSYFVIYSSTNSQGGLSEVIRTVLVSCPPFAAILPVSGLSIPLATLNGRANPDGIAASAWFEWGVGGLFDQTTPSTNVGSGNADVDVSADITGLAAGIAYQARIAASNASAVVRSVPVTFGTATIALDDLAQSYSGNPLAVTATTSPTGLAVVLTYDGSTTNPINAGSYEVVATVTDAVFFASQTGLFVVAKGDQSIDFQTSSTQQTTDAVGLAANATSGLAVTFSVFSGPGALAGGTNLTFTAAGIVLVVASQGGDTNWNPAAVTNAIDVTKAIASVNLSGLSAVYNSSSHVVTASTVPTGLTVNVTYDGSGVAPINAGSYTVTGQVSDVVYQGVQTGTLQIDKGVQSITFPPPPTQTTTNRVGLTATAASGLSVSFSVESGPGLISGGTNLTFTGTGLVAIVAAQAGNSNWYPAALTNSISVTKAIAPVTLVGLTQPYTGSPLEVTATTQPTGLVVFITYDGGTSQPVSIGSYAIQAVVDDTMYQGSQTGTLVVTKGEQPIQFDAIGPQVTTNLVGLTAFVTSGLPVSFSVLSGAGVIADATNLSFTGDGVVLVVASHTGDTNWNPNAVTNSITVTKAVATVQLSDLTQEYDGSPRPIAASTFPTGLTVVITYDGSATAPSAVGSHSVTGTVSDLIYQGLTAGTLIITKGMQTIAFDPPTQVLRNASIGLFATASSGLPVTFTVGAGPGVLNDDTNLSFTAGGIIRVDAVQSGDGDWDPTTTSAYIRVIARALDFDGDGLADVAIFTPNTGMWKIIQSSGGTSQLQFGYSGTLPVAADYDADGLADYALYEKSPGRWYVIPSASGSPHVSIFGASAKLAVPGDYDGDGATDIATYTPVLGQWLIEASGTHLVSTQQWGWSASMPVPADYDGDGFCDIAVYYPAGSTWYVKKSSGGSIQRQWGSSKMIPVPEDYDGDGKADIASYNPANGTWYISYSGGGSLQKNWGWNAAAPVPGDYDGDGLADIAVYYPAGGTWYIRKSSGGMMQVQLGGSKSLPVTPQFQLNRKYFPTP